MSAGEFGYADTAIGGPFNRNHVLALEAFTVPPAAQDCYTTFLRFTDDLIAYMQTHPNKNGKPSVAGYPGPALALFVPFDFDCEKDPTRAHVDAKRVVQRWMARYDVPAKAIRVFFSGCKGFSVELPATLFGGFEPSTDVAERLKRLAVQMAGEAETLDLTIYEKMRLWRVPNTINAKTGLYKVPLTVEDLLTLDLAAIKALAAAPRQIDVPSDDKWTVTPELQKLWADTALTERKEEIGSRSASADLSPARVLQGVPQGERDVTLFRYACRLRTKGLDRAEAETLVCVAADKCEPPFPEADALKKVESAFKYENDDDDCFELLDDEEIEDLPSPECLIEGILPSEALAVLYGPPEVKKSFLCLDWALSIRSGQPWCGRAVKSGAVVYVYAEGKGKLKLRTRAWKQTHDGATKIGAKFITQAVHVLQRSEVERLLRTLRKLPEPPKFIILDTLARCIQGGDENSAKDIGLLIGVADQLRDEFHATVLIVHHPGKNGDERGSTALRGAADTMIEMKEKDDIITLSCEKQKEDSHFKPILLECHEVDLGGEQTSCVLQLADEGKNASDLRSGFLNDKQRQALRALLDLGSAGARSTAWQKATGIPETTFKRIRRDLYTNHYVDKTAGIYMVTAKGELALTPIPKLGSEGELPQPHPLPPASGSGRAPQVIRAECDDREEDIARQENVEQGNSPIGAGSMGPEGSTEGPCGIS